MIATNCSWPIQQDKVEPQPTSTQDPDQIAAWLRLLNTPGVGIQTALRLLSAFGLPNAIFAQSYSALIQYVPDAVAQALLIAPSADTIEQIEQTLAWLAQPDHYLLTLSNPDYPQRLLALPDPPLLLYVRGRCAALTQLSLAIVGARRATTQGIRDAMAFSRALAEKGITIVSGLAAGIDAAAHRGALSVDRQPLLAVMGTGIDRIYPAEHSELAEQIAEYGALISEFPLGAPPAKHHFPRRNRIIAGLSLGVLVIEAAAQSGSLITARIASEIGREVFALPGSIHAPLSKGCHALINQGATLTESVEDIFAELAFTLPHVMQQDLHKTVQQTGITQSRDLCTTRRTRQDQGGRSTESGVYTTVHEHLEHRPTQRLAGAASCAEISSESPQATRDNQAQKTIRPPLLGVEQKIYDLFLDFARNKGPAPFSFDEVGDYLKLDTADITTFLLELELTGKISMLPGGKYLYLH